MNDITVLMTGAGAPGAPGIINCYRNNGERKIRVIGVDMKERISTINYLDRFYRIPMASSPDFIEVLLDISQNEKVDVIQPLVTRELEIFSSNVALFRNINTKICVCPIENLEIANDKGKLLNFLAENNIPVSKYKIINDSKMFRESCAELGWPEKPVCFKPTKSNGSRGFRVIDANKNKADILFKEKPNSTYIDIDDAEGILNSMVGIPELIIMEYLPGVEYSVDMLVDNGVPLFTIPRRRMQMNGGISTDCIIEKNDEVISYCEEIAKSLKLDGNIGIQVKADENGKYRILEINPRVQGSIVACAAAGVNLPYFAIKKKLGEQLPQVNIDWGMEMIRHWKESYYDSTGHAFTY
jgi:carbamoyl-phosphate synthase large subunit